MLSKVSKPSTFFSVTLRCGVKLLTILKINLREVVNISISSLLEPLKQLFLDLIIDSRCDKRFFFASSFSSLDFSWQWNQLFLSLKPQFSHTNKVLCDLYQTLFAFLTNKTGPKYLEFNKSAI